MDDIESSIAEIQRLIRSKAPFFCPAVFPSNSCPYSNIYDIINDTNESQRAQIQKWLYQQQCTEDQIKFSTEFNYKQRVITITPVKVS